METDYLLIPSPCGMVLYPVEFLLDFLLSGADEEKLAWMGINIVREPPMR